MIMIRPWWHCLRSFTSKTLWISHFETQTICFKSRTLYVKLLHNLLTQETSLQQLYLHENMTYGKDSTASKKQLLMFAWYACTDHTRPLARALPRLPHFNSWLEMQIIGHRCNIAVYDTACKWKKIINRLAQNVCWITRLNKSTSVQNNSKLELDLDLMYLM